MTSRSEGPDGAGVFTISLDFELIWGTADLFGPEKFRRACEAERQLVPRLLDLFVEFRVPATWCILGHLFLDSCRPGKDGRAHPSLPRPRHSWHPGDWYEHDPGGDEAECPLHYGRSLVRLIRACPVEQEIGSHSFSHAIFGDPGCTAEVADAELAECVRVARAEGIELRSFAFPRNSVGHLDALRRHGFACYRGPDPEWYANLRLPAIAKRLLHLWDVLRAAEPPVSRPVQVGEGLWNVPGSMIYFPMHGMRRYIPVQWRIRRAVRGLEAAARQRRVFHLWFHPTNLADQTETMFAGLRAILGHADRLRASGELKVVPMSAAIAP